MLKDIPQQTILVLSRMLPRRGACGCGIVRTFLNASAHYNMPKKHNLQDRGRLSPYLASKRPQYAPVIRGAPLCDRRSARTTGPRVRYVAVCREGRRHGRSSLEIVLLGPAHAPGTAHRAAKSCSAEPRPFHGATGSAWCAPWAEDPAPEPSAIEADACSRKRACAKMRMGEASRAWLVLTAPAVGPGHRAKVCCPHGPRAQAWRAA